MPGPGTPRASRAIVSPPACHHRGKAACAENLIHPSGRSYSVPVADEVVALPNPAWCGMMVGCGCFLVANLGVTNAFALLRAAPGERPGPGRGDPGAASSDRGPERQLGKTRPRFSARADRACVARFRPDDWLNSGRGGARVASGLDKSGWPRAARCAPRLARVTTTSGSTCPPAMLLKYTWSGAAACPATALSCGGTGMSRNRAIWTRFRRAGTGPRSSRQDGRCGHGSSRSS